MISKRLLSLLLAICCILALIPAVPVAVEATPEKGTISVPFQQNPLYKGLVDPEIFTVNTSYRPPVYKGESDYVSMATAAKQIRKAMVNREPYVTVRCTTTDSDLSGALEEIFEKALAHTGKPKEGDYLKFTHGGWEANGSYISEGDTYYLDVSYDLYYYTTAKQEAMVDDYIDDLLDDLDLEDNSDYQKIKGIYDYITETVRYDYDHLNDSSYMLQYTAYAALVNKTAVCQGYANLFYRLAMELDVDARIIGGYGGDYYSGGPHAWNITTLDDLWYNLDATWDEGQSTYSWFLLSPGSFVDHERYSEFDTSSFHKKQPMDENDYKYDANKSNIQIDTQPKNVTVNDGERAKVTVKARGEDLTYQWYIKDPGDEKYTKSSCKKATYSLEMTSEKSGRLAYCLIKDAYGNKLKTKTISLKVNEAVKITQEPKGVAVAEGEVAKATVKATGNGLKYQWYVKDLDDDSYTKSSNTTNTYSVKMSASRSGRRVVCKITDSDGNTVKTSPVTLSQITITKQPKSVKASSGETAKTSVKASGDGLKYQWYLKNPGAEKYSKSSITGKTYSCTVNKDNNGRLVYCKITDKYGNSVKSDTASIKLSNDLKITSQPKGVAVGKDETAKATVKASGDGLKYQWYIKNPGAEKFTKSSVTGKTYSCTMNADKSGRKIYCVITDSTGAKVTSKTVTLSMIDITKQPKNAVAPDGEVIKASVSAKGSGLEYQWYIKNPDGEKFSKSSVTGKTYSCRMSEKNSGRQVYCLITDSHGNTMKSRTVALYVE